jgi:HEAT repeat protein
MTLSKIHDTRSIELLEKVVFDKHQNVLVRSMAGHELVTNEYADVSKEIERIVEDESIPVPVRAEVMGDLSVSGFQDVAWLRRVALGGTISKSTDVSLDEGSGIMWNAMRALGASKNPEATDILIDLQSQNPVNAILTEALRRRHDPKTIPVLISVLVSTEAKVSLSKETAAAALADLKAQAAVEPLQSTMTSSDDPLLIATLAEALGNIGDRRAIVALQPLVENIDKDPRFSQYHAQEKAGYGPIPPIKNALRKLNAENKR